LVAPYVFLGELSPVAGAGPGGNANLIPMTKAYPAMPMHNTKASQAHPPRNFIFPFMRQTS
jgi:hypothetical protein